jgi:hypothetical protein
LTLHLPAFRCFHLDHSIDLIAFSIIPVQVFISPHTSTSKLIVCILFVSGCLDKAGNLAKIQIGA